MSKWLEGAKNLEESSHGGLYFETQSASKALRQIRQTIQKTFPQMIFLLGEPGSGKSFLLNHLQNFYKNKRYCLMIENPYLTPEELLKRMLAFAHTDCEGKDVETMRLQAIEAYKDTPHIIMIDEGQLSQPPLREFIRILSDSKVFWFLIAMHTKEGEELLRSPHFYSRPHQVVYMGKLQKDECEPYLKKAIYDADLYDFVMSMGKKLIYKSWQNSHGNFRNFKKIYYHLFMLLDYANEHGKSNFMRPNTQLLEMATIKSGIVLSKVDTEDFEELANATKGNKNQYLKYLFVAFLAIILSLVGIFAYLNLPKNESIVNEKKPKVTQKNQKEEEQKSFEKRVEEASELYEVTEVEDLKEEALEDFDEVITDDEILIEDEVKEVKEPKKPTKKKIAEEVEKKPIKTNILQVNNEKPKKVNILIKRFLSSPTYELALDISKQYYDKKDYKNASSWAKKANDLDRKKEGAWVMYAKSMYYQGKKSEAKSALKLYLEYRNSKKARALLNQWE